MEKFYDKISKKLYKAIKKDAKRVLKEIESEKLYSVALVTDSDCIYELENYSAKLLNSEERYEQFLNRKEIGM